MYWNKLLTPVISLLLSGIGLPSCALYAQTPADIRRQFSAQTELINQYSSAVQEMELSLFDAWQDMRRNTGKSRTFIAPYECPTGPDPFYLQQAREKSGATGTQLKPQSAAFNYAYEQLESRCREVEIYYRLRKYEKDSFAQAMRLVTDFQALLPAFNRAKAEYEAQLARAQAAQNMPAPPAPWQTAEKNARAVLALVQPLLQNLRCNFNPATATRWPVEAVQKQIEALDLLLTQIDAAEPKIEYPSSHYYRSFLGCARDLLQSQKDLVDQYTLEARKSDRHANTAYWEMLNHYNGCLVPFFNQFSDSWPQNKYSPLKITRIAPFFELVSESENQPAGAGMFQDIPYKSFELQNQGKPVSPELNKALNKYAELIDEGVRITNNLLNSLQNSQLNRRSFPPGSTFYYYNDEHQLPRSLYQDAQGGNRNLPEPARESIQNQADVLFRMLTEMDELREELLLISRNKDWKNKGFDRIQAIRDRFSVLFATFDLYKDRMYADLEKIKTSRPPVDANNSWIKSEQSLTSVLKADRQILDTARKFYGPEKTTPVFQTDALEDAFTRSITDEYTNLKGIEKLGRSNGLCPYTPYEDVGTDAQRIRDYTLRYQSKKYRDFVYIYNNSIESYNRFVELSPEPLMKNIRRMELFALVDPPQIRPNETAYEAPKTPQTPQPPQTPPAVREKIVRDTVYIRDTVFLEKPPTVNESFYSLDGYAPNNLILLLDVSSSMRAPERLPLLQSSVESLVRLLRPQDILSVVIFSGTARVELAPTPGTEKETIMKAVRALKPGGKTDFDAGLTLAYQVAQQHYKRPGNNRIVLATDGEFTLTAASQDRIMRNAEADIRLSVFKFGQKPTPELKKVSDLGKGNLVSINAENAAIFMILEAKKE